jgi:hypothetical protein
VSPELGTLEHLEPRTLWAHEAHDFTPWLAGNLNLLAEALGLDLEYVQAEAAVGSFNADITARDTGRDRQVIIENQLEPTDHGHLGQLITYAAGLDAAVIVWISPEVREEHRQAIDWLNRHTSEKIEFFAISLDDSKPAVVFRLAASPNPWSKPISSSQTPEISSRESAYQEFFQGVVDELREKHQFTNAKKAQPQGWYAFTSGAVSGVTYNASFARGRLRAEVWIDVGDVALNKATYDALLAQKAEIESQTGELAWERLDQRRACRIALVSTYASIDDASQQSKAMRTWLVQALLTLKRSFGPLLVGAVESARQVLSQKSAESTQ